MSVNSPCEFFEWDSQFFGVRIGRIIDAVGLFGPWRTWAQNHDIDCLYLLLPSASRSDISEACRAKFLTVGERVTVERQIHEDLPSASDSTVRHATADDLPELAEIASSVHGATRFYQDPHFDNELCGRLYQLWIENHFAKAPIVVAELEGRVAGYVAYSAEEGAGSLGLVGVADHARGKGLGTAMTYKALGELRALGCDRCTVVTQGGNDEAMALYTRTGFEVRREETWLHWWREDAE